MLVLINNANKAKIHIKEITFVIGRGSILEVTDKKVSRNHGIINVVDPDGAINVKSTHPNPIFYKLQANIEQLRILSKDQDITLTTGDKFGLLENELWFEVAVEDSPDTDEATQYVAEGGEPAGIDGDTEPIEENVENEPQPQVSAENPDPPPAPAPQIAVRTIENINTAEPSPNSVPARRIPAWMVTQSEAESSTKRPADEPGQDSLKRVKVEPDTDNVASTSAIPTVTVKTEPPADPVKPKKEPADSSTKRPSCTYGIRCFRKRNQIHANAEAHPGDADYRRPDFPPAPSTAPTCPYGAGCYRRNPRHFVEFSHPDSSVYFPAVQQPGPSRQPVPSNLPRKRNVLVVANYFVDGSDDEDGDFVDSEDDAEYDPDKTEAEESDDEDETEVDTQDL